LQISAIYKPIQADMVIVGERIRSLKQSAPPQMTGLLEYALKYQGKLMRPALTLLAGKPFRYDRDLITTMAGAVELLHIATLIHDDTVDKAQLRRGQPTLSSMWGSGTAVLVGDFLFAASADMVASTDDIRAARNFARTIMAISNAELEANATAFDWRQNRERYYQRIGNKTASLFVLATQNGSMLSQAPQQAIESLRLYGYKLGLAFQIVDDVLDFIGEIDEMGKPVGHDLSQGTLTLPAILYLEQQPENNPIKRFFADRKDTESLSLAIETIGKSSIIQECYDIALEFCAEARRCLEILPPSPSKRSLEGLTEYVLQRKK
jgi:geranylgeranyl pyrophosphate synthase